MNPCLVASYFAVMCFSLIILSLLIKFLQSKPINEQFIRDTILMDLARIDGSLVFYLSIVVIVRETSGAFGDESLVNVLMFLLVGTMISKQALSDKEILFEYATF
jgi:hypothetical protein